VKNKKIRLEKFSSGSCFIAFLYISIFPRSKEKELDGLGPEVLESLRIKPLKVRIGIPEVVGH